MDNKITELILTVDALRQWLMKLEARIATLEQEVSNG
jgi:hypothetical protein